MAAFFSFRLQVGGDLRFTRVSAHFIIPVDGFHHHQVNHTLEGGFHPNRHLHGDRVIGILDAEEKGPAALVINRLDPAMVKRGDMLSVEDVLDLLAVELIGIVPEDENVIVASNRGQPLALEGKTKAGQAFQNIARRLMGEQVPFLELETQNLFQRLLGRK